MYVCKFANYGTIGDGNIKQKCCKIKCTTKTQKRGNRGRPNHQSQTQSSVAIGKQCKPIHKKQE